MTDRLYSTGFTARTCRRSTDWVRIKIDRGDIPAVRPTVDDRPGPRYLTAQGLEIARQLAERNDK